MINLQTRDPPDSFLRPTRRAYHEVLTQLSKQVRPRLQSGRRLVAEREVISTNILYCRSEMEELFLIALQDCNPERYPKQPSIRTRSHEQPSLAAGLCPGSAQSPACTWVRIRWVGEPMRDSGRIRSTTWSG